jgi:hypothetical protein
MEIIRSIHSAATKAKKPFLVIGGHALSVHGISRSTGDLDLMVEARDVDFWRELLVRLGYDVFHESSGFLQSKPGSPTAWPIDLMLVSADTMAKALKDAASTAALGPSVQVASVGSLIAMKLHTLKFVGDDRALKDQSDLLALLKLAGIGKDSDAFRQLCLRYATLEIYERFAEKKR